MKFDGFKNKKMKNENCIKDPVFISCNFKIYKKSSQYTKTKIYLKKIF